MKATVQAFHATHKSSLSRYVIWLVCALLLLGAQACATTSVDQEDEGEVQKNKTVVWKAWEKKEVGALGNDNTGATFAEREDPLTPRDKASLEVTPSGSAPRPKSP